MTVAELKEEGGQGVPTSVTLQRFEGGRELPVAKPPNAVFWQTWVLNLRNHRMLCVGVLHVVTIIVVLAFVARL